MAGITVGFDGSHSAQRALEWAMSEAAVRHAPLTVLTVHLVPASGWTGNPIVLPADAPELVAVNVRAVNGYPGEELTKASDDADLVVVGARGMSAIARLLLGSVSSEVLHHARCPVALIRDAG